MIDSGAKDMVNELYVDQFYLGGGAEIENTIVSMDNGLITEMGPFLPDKFDPGDCTACCRRRPRIYRYPDQRCL
jgi:hypothetical protein